MSALRVCLPVLLILCASCGYRLLGAGGALPPDIEVLAVLPFQRRVPVLDIDQRVTEQVTREFSRRTRARVQNTRSGADAVLTGIITQYGVVPLSYDDEGRANRFQVTMAAKITLTGKDGDILYRSENVRFSEGYESASLPDEYAYEEGLASETVAGDFARSLVGNILEASGSAPGRKGEGAEAAGSGGGGGP